TRQDPSPPDLPSLHGGKTCRLGFQRQIDLRGGEARGRRRNRARDALRIDRRERHACRGSDGGDAIGRNVVGHKLLPELLAGAAMAGMRGLYMAGGSTVLNGTSVSGGGLPRPAGGGAENRSPGTPAAGRAPRT